MRWLPDQFRAGGAKSWTRYELVSRVGCGNFKAVHILLDALQQLEIKSIKQLSELSPSVLAACRGVGTTTLFAAMSILDSEGIDVDKWYDADKTFASLKQAEQRAARHEPTKKAVEKKVTRRKMRERVAKAVAANPQLFR